MDEWLKSPCAGKALQRCTAGPREFESPSRRLLGSMNPSATEMKSPKSLLDMVGAGWIEQPTPTMGEIATYLGHTDTRTTERIYARYSVDYLRKAAASLEYDDLAEARRKA